MHLALNQTFINGETSCCFILVIKSNISDQDNNCKLCIFSFKLFLVMFWTHNFFFSFSLRESDLCTLLKEFLSQIQSFALLSWSLYRGFLYKLKLCMQKTQWELLDHCNLKEGWVTDTKVTELIEFKWSDWDLDKDASPQWFIPANRVLWIFGWKVYADSIC